MDFTPAFGDRAIWQVPLGFDLQSPMNWPKSISFSRNSGLGLSVTKPLIAA